MMKNLKRRRKGQGNENVTERGKKTQKKKMKKGKKIKEEE